MTHLGVLLHNIHPPPPPHNPQNNVSGSTGCTLRDWANRKLYFLNSTTSSHDVQMQLNLYIKPQG